MGKLVALFNMQSGLIVIATNGVWVISGGTGFGFAATEYNIRRISSIDTPSTRASLVNFKGTPVWWAQDGIYIVQFDANVGSFVVTPITDTTIKGFIEIVPANQRGHVKGVYDSGDDRIIWMISFDDGYSYTQFLCMDGRTNSFYPWNLTSLSMSIKDVSSVKSPEGLAKPDLKFYTENNNGGTFTFGDFKNSTYVDWTAFAGNSGDPLEEQDYESYFITAPYIHGETQKFFQLNHIFVFTNNEPNSSLFVQGVHDFTVNSDSNRWSTPQQACRSGPSVAQGLKFRKLKIRGKGRGIQLKMYSESRRPFTCIGWSTNESVNEQI
jgi:hypothetical protein